MEDIAKWYFTHQSVEDQLWYEFFFSLCKEFNISWPTATPAQRALIEEMTRISYERELAKQKIQL